MCSKANIKVFLLGLNTLIMVRRGALSSYVLALSRHDVVAAAVVCQVSAVAMVLHGLGVSVYTRVARMALAEKGVRYQLQAMNPFADPPPLEMAGLTRFGRIPVLDHDGFCLFETAAIVDYLDAGFEGASLRPKDARAAAQVVLLAEAGHRPVLPESGDDLLDS